MDLFNKAKVVTLRSHHDKYLVADADQKTVRQSTDGTSRKAQWRVELVENKPHVVRLKSCHGLYLTATDLPFLLGMTGQKVLQTDGAADNISDSKIEWEPIRVDGCQMKLRTSSGMYLRANSWLPPWRNSVTHDEPFRSSTQDWILWLVGVVEVEALSTELVPTDSLLSQQSSVSSSFSDELNGSENGSPMSSYEENDMQLINISDLSLKTDFLVRNNADQGFSAEWAFLIIGLFLEILSIAFDQAATPNKPHYALYGMLLAIGALFICTSELIYKGIKERVELKRWGMLWWFYHPPPRYTIFGTLPDMYGLIGGISQCVCSTVQYVFLSRHADNPIKVSLWPAIFLICLGASRLSKKHKVHVP